MYDFINLTRIVQSAISLQLTGNLINLLIRIQLTDALKNTGIIIFVLNKIHD